MVDDPGVTTPDCLNADGKISRTGDAVSQNVGADSLASQNLHGQLPRHSCLIGGAVPALLSSGAGNFNAGMTKKNCGVLLPFPVCFLSILIYWSKCCNCFLN